MVDDVAVLRRRLEALLGPRSTGGNRIEVLRNGDQIFPAMLEQIRGASHTIDLLTFIFRTGTVAEQFAEALAERARAGCRVRVLIDAMGGAAMPAALVEVMRGAGVRVEFFRKPWLRSPFTHNHRTHRKVLVVDGSTAFTGGVGISELWEGDARGPDEWRDTHIRVRGPVVAGLVAAFAQNWAETVGEPDEPDDEYPVLEPVGDDEALVVRGTATVGWDDIETAWYVLLTSARSRITLQTAYFAPDAAFLALLSTASQRGVAVDVLLPGPHSDKAVSRLASERHYDSLLATGVSVWRYQPTMLHTKVVTIDGQVAMIGSSNFNRRSLDHDEEVACIILSGEVPEILAGHFDADVQRASRIDPQRWRRRPARRRFAEQAVRPLSRYL